MTVEYFCSLQSFDEPYPHVASPLAFSREESATVLNWFETTAPWRLVEESFYEQYEFCFRDTILPSDVARVLSQGFLDHVTSKVEGWFDTSLSATVDITAHKLVSGQTIRVHNDFIPGQETHRLLIQFNRNWAAENGGLLMMFGSNDPADVRKIFRPAHNSCVAFEISKKSLHAVSTIHGGERFTLVFSYYAK